MLLVISSCNTQGYHNLYATKPLAIVMDSLTKDLCCYCSINPFNNQTIMYWICGYALIHQGF